MSATKTTEASLFDCPSHLLPGFVDKRFNVDCQMESHRQTTDIGRSRCLEDSGQG